MHFKFVAAAVAGALFALPAYATTFISGSVGIGVRAMVGTEIQNASDFKPVVAPTSVTIGAQAKATAVGNPGSAFVFANLKAKWVSADAGTVGLNWGWDNNFLSQTARVETNTMSPSPNWSYTFTASDKGRFFVNYNVMGFGDTFGLQPLYGSDDLSLPPLPGSVNPEYRPMGGNVFDPTGAGTFSVALLSGKTYTMSLFNFGNVSNLDGLDNVGNATARFNWKIDYRNSVVPEPATWALMIGGFGLAGAALRRRRAAVVA